MAICLRRSSGKADEAQAEGAQVRKDTPAQRDYAMKVATLLWPDPARVRLVRRPAGGSVPPAREWLVLPSPARPRMLVPVGIRSADRMLTRHSPRLGPRLARSVLGASVRTGVLERLPVARLVVDVPEGDEPDSVERHLAAVLGCEVATGVLLGTPRTNRKPVVQVFDMSGRTLAFVKAAHDDSTRSLVRRETKNLRQIAAAGLTRLEVPVVLHAGQVRELDILVLSPLTSSQEDRPPTGRAPLPLAAMNELARMGGVRTYELHDSPFLTRLRSVADEIAGSRSRERLANLLRRVVERDGETVVEFGNWHGDWAPWNMGWRGGRVQLWDWERFAQDVPLGFDAVHYRTQLVRHGRRGLREAEDALIAELAGLLAGVGVPPQRAQLTLVLYLLELSCRFLAPQEGGAGGEHARASWALSLAERLVPGGRPGPSSD